MIPIATLAGVTLEAIDEVGWVFPEGTRPYQRTFELSRPNALELWEKSRRTEVELYMERDEGTLLVRALTVLSVGPSRHPDRLSVFVSDRRWKWKHVLVRRDFNVRRRVGEMRFIELSHLSPANLAADVAFAAYSLKDPPQDAKAGTSAQPWKSKEAFLDVLAEVTSGAFEGHDEDFGPSVDVDGLVLRDPGDAALDRMFAFIPGLSIRLDENGIAHTKNQYNGAEGPELEASPVALDGPYLLEYATHERSRAYEVEVYFQCEDEIRFDFTDPPQSTDSTRVLENTLPLPDTIRYVSGPRNGQTIVQGTWAPIDQYLFDAWNNTKVNDIVIGPGSMVVPQWDFPTVRRLFVYPGGYNIYLEADDQDRITARRWNAIAQHFRQSFRVPRTWVDRSFEFQPTRLAIVDPVNGTRAPADCYADHAEVPTMRRVAFAEGNPQLKLAVNFYAWDPLQMDPRSNPLEDGIIADSAYLTPLDLDAFVFKLMFKPQGNHLNDTATILPSALASLETGESEIPSADIKTAGGAFMLHASDGLSKYHRFSTVIALASASPQGRSGLYRVTVTAQEAKAAMPISAGARMPESQGPAHMIFVGADVMTASSAWRDDQADAIDACVLRGQPRSEERLLYPDHIKNVALSFAAAHYLTTVDRWEGSKVTTFDPKRKPVGLIQAVSHRLDEQGRFTTELDLSPDIQEPNWMAFLPESTRRKQFRKIQRAPMT